MSLIFYILISEHILRNQNLIIGLDSYSRQRFIYLDPLEQKKFCTLGSFGEFYLNLKRILLMLYIVV